MKNDCFCFLDTLLGIDSPAPQKDLRLAELVDTTQSIMTIVGMAVFVSVAIVALPFLFGFYVVRALFLLFRSAT